MKWNQLSAPFKGWSFTVRASMVTLLVVLSYILFRCGLNVPPHDWLVGVTFVFVHISLDRVLGLGKLENLPPAGDGAAEEEDDKPREPQGNPTPEVGPTC